MLHDRLQQHHHLARDVDRNRLADLRARLLQGLAVGFHHAANIVRRDADAVVGKDAVGAHLLGQREVRGADGDGQERRDVAGDAETDARRQSRS